MSKSKFNNESLKEESGPDGYTIVALLLVVFLFFCCCVSGFKKTDIAIETPKTTLNIAYIDSTTYIEFGYKGKYYYQWKVSEKFSWRNENWEYLKQGHSSDNEKITNAYKKYLRFLSAEKARKIREARAK